MIGDPFHDAAARKLQIRDAALAIVERGGINDLTMRALGVQVGISAAAIYGYYWSRTALLVELHEIVATRVVQSITASDPNNDLSNGIRFVMQRYLEWSLDHPGLFDLLHGHTAASTERCGSVAEVAVNTIAQRARQAGFADGEATTLALTLWSSAEGLLSLYRTNKIRVGRSEFPALYMRSVDFLVTSATASHGAVRRHR